MKIAMYQMRMHEDVQANIEKSLNALREAAGMGAELIVYPEIQLSPFFPQFEKQNVVNYAMTLSHPFITGMQEACREYHIMAAPNVYLCENGRYFDTTLLISSTGEIIGAQKMVHIAQAEQFYEQDYYAPADDGFKVFDTELGKIGVVVCFDRHYPESVRTEALMGAELILIPTANTSAEPSEMFEWELRVQAFQNSCPIVMCNRTGLEAQMDFCGESIAVDAYGNTIVKADAQEGIILADIDIENTLKVRNSKPYTQLRRTELYL